MNRTYELLRAVRGPIVLIVLGGLFALDQSMEGVPFSRTWPILIIVFGVLKLFERMAAPPVMPPPVPPPPYVPQGGMHP